MSFRKYGGKSYNAKNNYVNNNYQNSISLNSVNGIGKINSSMNFLSDLSGNIETSTGIDLLGGDLLITGKVSSVNNEHTYTGGSITSLGGNIEIRQLKTNYDNKSHGGNLTVSALTTTNEFICIDTCNIEGNLNITEGLITMNNGVYLDSNSLLGTLNICGTCNINGNLIVNGGYISSTSEDIAIHLNGKNVTIGNDLIVKNDIQINRNVSINGNNTLINSICTINGALIINNNITVKENTIIEGNILLNGNIQSLINESAINFNNKNIDIVGSLTILENTIKSSSSVTCITLDNANVRISKNIYADNFIQYSDMIIKENISKIDNSEYSVDKLTPVEYNLKGEDNIKKIGFIVDDLEKTHPFMVKTIDENTKCINYNSIIGILVNEIQELKHKVTELERIIKKNE